MSHKNCSCRRGFIKYPFHHKNSISLIVLTFSVEVCFTKHWGTYGSKRIGGNKDSPLPRNTRLLLKTSIFGCIVKNKYTTERIFDLCRHLNVGFLSHCNLIVNGRSRDSSRLLSKSWDKMPKHVMRWQNLLRVGLYPLCCNCFYYLKVNLMNLW